MALTADVSVEEKALSAKEWISQSSASRKQQLSLSSMKKSESRRKEGKVSPERSHAESILFSGMNLAHVGSVEVVLLALDVPVGNDNEGEIPPLSPTSATLIKSKSSRWSSSNLSGKSPAHCGCLELDLHSFDMPMCSSSKREDGVPPLTSTASPMMTSKNSKSSSNHAMRDGEIPRLTSTCSPLITSKSSKSSSNQGSLPGLVVAPDGVTLVKDRRKCKPRGVLTVGLETSSFSSEGDVPLPLSSPSMATVQWVDENWDNALSPHQSHPEELDRSCSSVTSKSVRSPRVALNFDFHQEGREDLRVNIREVADLRPGIVSSIQESHDVKESDEGRPADLIFADGDVSIRPKLAPELLPSDKDSSASTSSGKQQHHVRSTQLISPQKQLVFSDLDNHHSLDIHQSLQLEPQDGLNGSPSSEIVDRPCDFGSDMIRSEHSETRFLPVKRSDIHLGIPENRSSEVGSLCPFSVSPNLLASPENQDVSSADVTQSSLTDIDHSQDSPVVMQKHGEGLETLVSEPSQRLRSPEELVAETLYELAAENLRKTRTRATRFHSLEEKKSPTEAASLLSPVKQSVSSVGTSTCSDHATHTDAVPYYVLSSRISRHDSSRLELVKVDFAQPRLKTMVLSHESNFSQELITLKALIGNVDVDAHVNDVEGLAPTFRVHEEAENPDQSTLALSKKPRRQFYYSNGESSIRKAQQQRRLSPCSKRAGFGSIIAAFGIVIMALAMGSCQHCYKSNEYQYYIRPT